MAITFDPIPVPSRQALANEPPPAASQQSVIDANFAKINTYLGSVAPVSAGIREQGAYVQTTLGPPGVWGAYPGMTGKTLIVPDCAGLLLYVGGQTATVWVGWITISAVLSGPGVVGEVRVGMSYNSGSWADGGASRLVDRSQLVVGQPVTLSCQYMVSATATYRMGSLEVGAIPVG